MKHNKCQLAWWGKEILPKQCANTCTRHSAKELRKTCQLSRWQQTHVFLEGVTQNRFMSVGTWPVLVLGTDNWESSGHSPFYISRDNQNNQRDSRSDFAGFHPLSSAVGATREPNTTARHLSSFSHHGISHAKWIWSLLHALLISMLHAQNCKRASGFPILLNTCRNGSIRNESND